MSNTPRTNKYEQHWIENGNAHKLISLTRQLETELNEMRSLFTSYVLCEEAWRNKSTDNKVNVVMEANFMREKAKKLLKL